MKELPGDLKGDEGFAGPGGQSEKDALLFFGDGFHGVVDGDLLVIAHVFGAADIFKGDAVEFVAPVVLFGRRSCSRVLPGSGIW